MRRTETVPETCAYCKTNCLSIPDGQPCCWDNLAVADEWVANPLEGSGNTDSGGYIGEVPVDNIARHDEDDCGMDNVQLVTIEASGGISVATLH